MQENLEEYLVQSDMQCNGVWGTDVEVVVAAHLLDVNIAMFNVPVGDYVVRGGWSSPWITHGLPCTSRTLGIISMPFCHKNKLHVVSSVIPTVTQYVSLKNKLV